MTEGCASFLDFARLVLDALEAAEVEHLIGGAVALWVWGELRTTQNLDLVANLPTERIDSLSKELARQNMLVPPDRIVELLRQTEGDAPVKVDHTDSGYSAKIFLVRQGDKFREKALARRQLVDLGSPLGQVYVHTPEDLIINKLHFFSIGSDTKHLRDIASIMAMSHDRVDIDYITAWTNSLELTSMWLAMQEQFAEMLDWSD